VKLSLGAQLLDFSYSAEAWARLKLVVPHRFSFEVEPLVLMGIRAKPIEAWWDPAVVQDGNQSRVFLTFDANLQLTPHVLVWVDAIPFLPTARFETPNDAALELAAGLGVAITKAFEMSVSCYSLDTRSARRWEYVPDVRGCALSLLARRFGRAPAGPGVVPVPRSLY
jgi:hypothetical protein